MDGYGFASFFFDGYGWIWILQTLSMSISTSYNEMCIDKFNLTLWFQFLMTGFIALRLSYAI